MIVSAILPGSGGRSGRVLPARRLHSENEVHVRAGGEASGDRAVAPGTDSTSGTVAPGTDSTSGTAACVAVKLLQEFLGFIPGSIIVLCLLAVLFREARVRLSAGDTFP